MFDDTDLVSSRERAAVLALMAGRKVAITQLAEVLEEEGSALGVLAKLETERSDRLFAVDDRQVSLDQLEDYVLTLANTEGITLLTVLDKAYPVNLRMVYDRPAALFVRGALRSNDGRSVAVVGTRKPTDHGRECARTFAASLSEAGYVVVSGLAAGIDTAAHTATLDAAGRTVAVIGTGLRESYPKPNALLQERIATESAVISQFWPGQGPRPWTFPARNRVMSGFAQATVVVEAGDTSGARMQARFALEHGRPVFLLRSLLKYEWAQDYAKRAGTYVVDAADAVIEVLERLYAEDFTLTA